MLPIVLIGDNHARMKQLEQSFPMQMPAPLRLLEISAESSALLPLPALTCSSIIVLDVEHMFNPQVAQYIHRLRMAYPDSAVVVLLQFGDDEGESNAVAAGADDVLMKPISPQRIALTMRNLSELVHLRSALSGTEQKYTMPRTPVGNMGVSLLDRDGQVKKFHHIEQEIIRATIAFFDGHVSKASRALGIGRSTLYRKVDTETITQVGRVARA